MGRVGNRVLGVAVGALERVGDTDGIMDGPRDGSGVDGTEVGTRMIWKRLSRSSSPVATGLLRFKDDTMSHMDRLARTNAKRMDTERHVFSCQLQRYRRRCTLVATDAALPMLLRRFCRPANNGG